MKCFYFIFALLTLFTSCELRSTNFDPDEQLVSDDECAEIALWDQYQNQYPEDKISTEEYECRNPDEFVLAEFKYRQNTDGKWIIEGSLRNFATKAHFKNAELVISFYNKTHTLIGTDNYIVNDDLFPGDNNEFYFKSNKFKEAHSLRVDINRVKSVRK